MVGVAATCPSASVVTLWWSSGLGSSLPGWLDRSCTSWITISSSCCLRSYLEQRHGTGTARRRGARRREPILTRPGNTTGEAATMGRQGRPLSTPLRQDRTGHATIPPECTGECTTQDPEDAACWILDRLVVVSLPSHPCGASRDRPQQQDQPIHNILPWQNPLGC